MLLAHQLAQAAQGVILERGFVGGFVEVFADFAQMLHGLVEGAEQLHVVNREQALVRLFTTAAAYAASGTSRRSRRSACIH